MLKSKKFVIDSKYVELGMEADENPSGRERSRSRERSGQKPADLPLSSNRKVYEDVRKGKKLSKRKSWV